MNVSLYQQWPNVAGNFSSRNCYKLALVSHETEQWSTRAHSVRGMGGWVGWGGGQSFYLWVVPSQPLLISHNQFAQQTTRKPAIRSGTAKQAPEHSTQNTRASERSGREKRFHSRRRPVFSRGIARTRSRKVRPLDEATKFPTFYGNTVTALRRGSGITSYQVN